MFTSKRIIAGFMALAMLTASCSGADNETTAEQQAAVDRAEHLFRHAPGGGGVWDFARAVNAVEGSGRVSTGHAYYAVCETARPAPSIADQSIAAVCDAIAELQGMSS